MTPWLTSLALWVADYYALATVLLGVAALVGGRESNPSRRMVLAWVAVAALVVLAGLVAMPIGPQVNIGCWEAVTTVDSAPAPTRLAWLGTAFLVGFLTVAVWLGLGALRAGWLLHRSREAPSFIHALLCQLADGRPPRLRTHRQLGQPVALGICRPTIVLPDAFESAATQGQMKHLLRHEWAHIRHGDLWLLALTRLLLLALFAHPLYWWLRSHMRDDQELLADAAAAGDAPVDYAHTLLHWSRIDRSTVPAAALAFAARPSRLKRRLAALLDPAFARPTSSPGAWCLTTGSIALGLVLFLSAVTLRNRPEAATAAAVEVVAPTTPVAPATPVAVVETPPVVAQDTPPTYRVEIQAEIGVDKPQLPTLKIDSGALAPTRTGPGWVVLWWLWETFTERLRHR